MAYGEGELFVAATPEGKVKEMVRKALKAKGVYTFMPVQMGYGAPALDFYCCYKGRFFAIETKAPGKKMTARQEVTYDEILKAGGGAFVVSNEDELLHVLAWMELVT